MNGHPWHVLVVDDDPDAREQARRALEQQELRVTEAADGKTALVALAEDTPDLILLDLGMPGMGGLELLSQLRRTSSLPVIVLSGRQDETDRVLALELGADDYVVKPFLVRELPARIRSVLRRCRTDTPVALQFDDLEILIPERRVVVKGTVAEMTAREFDLLAKLASHPGRVFSRADLLTEVWGSSKDWQDPATVTEHVRRIRRKIEENPEEPRWIQTVRNVGYRFEP